MYAVRRADDGGTSLLTSNTQLRRVDGDIWKSYATEESTFSSGWGGFRANSVVAEVPNAGGPSDSAGHMLRSPSNARTHRKAFASRVLYILRNFDKETLRTVSRSLLCADACAVVAYPRAEAIP